MSSRSSTRGRAYRRSSRSATGWVLAVVALVIGVVAVGACVVARRESPPAVSLSVDDLERIVVRETDLPPGYILNEERRTGTDEFVRYFADPEAARVLLERWGRQGGVSTLLTNVNQPRAREPLQVASAVERYPTAERARLRYDGRGQLFKNWSAAPVAVSAIDLPPIGDQSTAGRMFVTDETGRELVVYSITLRSGSVVADVTTTGLKNKDDKGEQAIRLARLVNERIIAHID